MLPAKLFTCRYNESSFNCVHFLNIAWLELYEQDISDVLSHLLARDRTANKELRYGFNKLSKPESPCIVIANNYNGAHVWIYIKGKVFHLSFDGVKYEPLSLAFFGFRNIRYYKPCQKD